MKLSTIAKTVQCPFCQTGYTFKTLENKKNWQARGASEPLHAECKAAAREQAKKSCPDCGGDCDSILKAAQQSLDAAKPKAMKIRLQYKDGSIYNWTIRKASGGWEFTDHENYTRHSEGNWLALVSKFKLVAENYGMTLMSELS